MSRVTLANCKDTRGKDVNNKENGVNPLGLIAVTLLLLAVFLFYSGLSEMPNKPLQNDAPVTAIWYMLSAILSAVLAKVFWSKANKKSTKE